MKTRFRFWVGVSLVLVYMVIAAGAIVRVTGTGTTGLEFATRIQ